LLPTGIIDAGYSSITPSFLLWQSQGSYDPLEIVRTVVLNFNAPAFVSVMDNDVRCQMLLQPVL